MDIPLAQLAPVVIIASTVMPEGHVAFANPPNQLQRKKIQLVQNGYIPQKKVILPNAGQQRKRERGAVVLQDQMAIAGNMGDSLTSA